MEDILDDLFNKSIIPVEKMNFIIIQTIHSCQVILPEQTFWPLELTISAFNLADGMKCFYWTVIDTVTFPKGQGSKVKETSEETGLPEPGSPIFDEKHREYRRIILNIKKFIEKFLADYEEKYILFAMDSDDIESADGCLQWLSDHAKLNEEEGKEMDDFINKLQFVKLPKLLLKFAGIAKSRNEDYNSLIALDNTLVESAKSILTHPRYNFNRNITCNYHNQYGPSLKMNVCTQNVALRIVYLILEEIVPAMLIQKKDGHLIEKASRALPSQPAILPGQTAAYSYAFRGARALPQPEPPKLTNKRKREE